MKIKHLDDQNDNIKFTDANGTEWVTTLSSDGQIPQRARDALANGAEEIPFAPPVIPIDDLRTQGIVKMVIVANQLTDNILQRYPEAEQKLWGKYETEARAFNLATPQSNTVSDYPALTGMLDAKYGPAAATEQKERLAAAVPGIITNADNWLKIAQYVSGLRARTEGLIMQALSEDEINTILAAAKTEAMAVAKQMGLIE